MKTPPESDPFKETEATAASAAFRDDLAIRLAGDSTARAVGFAVLILAFNIWDRYVDAAHANEALLWRAATALAILLVHGIWVISRTKSYALYRRLVLTHTVTVPLGMTCAVSMLQQGLLYGLSNFIFLYIWIPSVLPSRRDALMGGIFAALTILAVASVRGGDALAVSNIATLVVLGTILSTMTAIKFEAALRRAWTQEQIAIREARTDMLTGTMNRRRFEEAAAAEWGRCMRYGRKAAIILLDLDWFKLINDAYGHVLGDVVLKKVARACQAEIRDIDLLARLGGEEFAVLLPETDVAAGAALAERLRLKIMGIAIDTPTGPLQPTASFGVAPLPAAEAESWAASVGLADAAMYRAKKNGRNRVEVAADSQGIVRPY